MTDIENKPPVKEADSSSKLRTSKTVSVAVKLNGTNYPLWARLMKIAIGSRGAYRHITGVPKPPEPGEDGYLDWEETDLVVFSWIVDNIETEIVVDFAHHQTAQAIWESLSVTFESTTDPYLLYDLDEKISKITQGELNLETYWRHLHGNWVEIDRCQDRPINCCDKGVSQFRRYTATRRLFKFLAGLGSQYDGIRRDILKESPLPSVEIAYGWVKREATRLKIMPSTAINPPVAISDESSSGVGYGLAARGQRPAFQQRSNHQQQPPRTVATNNRRGGNRPDKSKLWCSHCGQQKHTRETCFQLVGYPEWWDETQKAKARLAIGVDGGGSEQFAQPGTGSRETTGVRGKIGDVRLGEGSSGGGGGREGAGEKGAEVALAERRSGGSVYGGKGLGWCNPNPTYNF